MALPDVLGTMVGRLVADEFPDPARLAALGAARFVRFAATTIHTVPPVGARCRMPTRVIDTTYSQLDQG